MSEPTEVLWCETHGQQVFDQRRRGNEDAPWFHLRGVNAEPCEVVPSVVVRKDAPSITIAPMSYGAWMLTDTPPYDFYPNTTDKPAGRYVLVEPEEGK